MGTDASTLPRNLNAQLIYIYTLRSFKMDSQLERLGQRDLD